MPNHCPSPNQHHTELGSPQGTYRSVCVLGEGVHLLGTLKAPMGVLQPGARETSRAQSSRWRARRTPWGGYRGQTQGLEEREM